ncbi:MAG: lysylphosphatidylglycerol synthase transmembrane domain-containing protein [Nannocystaceae bacterium]
MPPLPDDADAAPRAPARSGRRRVWVWLGSLAGGAVLLTLASRRLELIPRSFEIPRPELLAAAIALHVPYALTRAGRLRYALDPLVQAASGGARSRLPPTLLYGSGLFSFLVIMLLPLRLGELSRPLLLARAEVPGVGLAEAISAVGTERVVDGLTVVGLLFLGIALAAPSSTAELAEVQRFGHWTAGIFGVALAGVISVAVAPEATISRFGLQGRAAAVLRHVAAAVRPLGRPRQGIPFLLWTVTYWALIVIQLWLVLGATGLDLGLAEAAAIVAAIGLSIQLPGGPAQAGSFQVGAAAGLSLFIDPAALAGAGSSFSAVMYLIGLGGALVVALPGVLLLRGHRGAL